MKSEYQKIISKTLKSYRKEKGFSLEKLAELCDSSPSSLSKIENNKYYGHYDTLIYIFDKLGISFIIDPELIEYYDSLFDNMYLGVVKLDDDIVNEYHDKIEDNKDNILNSLCKHRYYAYEFIYRMYDNVNVIFTKTDRLNFTNLGRVIFTIFGEFYLAHVFILP